ncbi:MAG: hypothetical protein R3C58_14890 [Parvularculaceae bacterium]
MKLVAKSKDATTVQLDHAEMAIINNALNKVANGIHFDDAELHTRTGFERHEIKALLKDINALLERRY